ncbi:hypothetical protein ACTXT7_008953 [Hymenolepis weldensis]
MQMAWRERNPEERIKKAREALAKNPECVTAMILLAEEECSSINEVEKMFKQAYKISESSLRKSQQSHSHNPIQDAIYLRDIHAFIFIRRRLAMCARKLGKLREAIKIMRELIREYPNLNLFNIHENLIECYLAAQQYADAQAFLTKYDDILYPKSATICYTAALLKARQVAEKFSPDIASKRGLNNAELSAVEAIHRAVEFNPHVPRLARNTAVKRLLSYQVVIEDDKSNYNPATRIFVHDVQLMIDLTTSDFFKAEKASRKMGLIRGITGDRYLLEMKPLILPTEHILKRGDSEALAYSFFHLAHWKAVEGALNLLHCTWEGTFRLIPYPLEKGNLFHPYPHSTESTDRELLPNAQSP